MIETIYIKRSVLNYSDIIEWAKESGFTSVTPHEDLHVTIVYCKKKVDWADVSRHEPEQIIDRNTNGRSIEMFDDNACVMEIESESLLARNTELAKLGIKGNFPDYRAHITITYDKPKDLDVGELPPYMGPIVLGPEEIEAISDTKNWRESRREIPLVGPVSESYQIDDLDEDAVYEVFRDSYIAATGSSWTKEQFMRRARNWEFYGDERGFVAVRPQRSGMLKLVAVAGDIGGIMRGLNELNSDPNRPIWGAVSEKLANSSKRFGFIAPHRFIGGPALIKMIFSKIPASVLGGNDASVNPDGSITMSVDGVGEAQKYMIANKAYFKEMAKQPATAAIVGTSKLAKTILGI